MFERKLKNQIQQLQEVSKIVAPRPEWIKSNRDILLMQIRNTIDQKTNEKFDFQQISNILNIFLPKQIINYAVKPVFVLFLIFGVISGGWITTVSASYNSLPGDVLYNVKLATESVQTSLSGKPQSVKLRVEFAGRRVEEVKQIVKSNLSKPQKEQKVEEAVKHLKSDLTQAKSSLEEIKKNDVSKSQSVIVDVAKVVDQKTNEIQKNLDVTKVQLATENTTPQANPVQEQVKQATAMAVETGVKAVEILVQTHQENKDSISAEEVKTAVDNKLKNLEDKVTNIEAQMSQVTNATSTLVNTIQEKKEDKATKEKLVEPVKETTKAAKVSISQAKDELAKDNLGAAMDKIKEGSVLTLAAEVKADATKILAAPVLVVTSTLNSSLDKLTATSTIVAPAQPALEIKVSSSTEAIKKE